MWRRRPIVPTGSQAIGPTATTTEQVVVLHDDFLNVVGGAGASSGYECEMTRDSDRGVRTYVPPIDFGGYLGSVSGGDVVEVNKDTPGAATMDDSLVLHCFKDSDGVVKRFTIGDLRTHFGL
jgi:hypothetical protein